MADSIIRSILRTARGHIMAGVFTFNAFKLDFSIEKLQRKPNTYAVMAETQNPFCVGYVTM